MWFKDCVKKLLDLLRNFLSFNACMVFLGLNLRLIFKSARLIKCPDLIGIRCNVRGRGLRCCCFSQRLFFAVAFAF